ncbi:MAG TPA: aminotransferase class V-fold PLP-dependent enzyme [Bryobacteraceae bacterium]|nr:aminotransferase class V-fold PLP-dependent enzyme [Bryobacteraceae bacterium]
MDISRRNLIAAAGGSLGLATGAAVEAASTVPGLPMKSEFAVVNAQTCLNNARWHPISAGATKAIQQYLEYKAGGGGSSPDYGGELQKRAKALFAQLIHARPSEVSFVPSTTVGENLVAAGLGLPHGGGNVVTDALHFEGSLYQYGALAKQGLDVRIVRPRDWRIELSDLDRVIDAKTKLVALSLVSMVNGFQHDLKAVCDLAHSRGALVYADAVQAVGAIPVDVRASGIDFLACSSYKWLMGDMGLGFLYVREDLLPRMQRSQYGFRQLTRMDYHVFPFDPPGENVMDWTQGTDAGSFFEVGTVSNTTLACLTYSLDLIQKLGVEKIQAYRRPLLAKLHKEMPRFGFEPMTPSESASPIVTFSKRDARELSRRLRQAKIDIAVYEHRVRISPSIYNDQADVEKLLDSL